MDPVGLEKSAFKIMVVDDSEIVREYLIRILNQAGYTDVTQAATGAEALELLEQDDYHLLMLDIQMPEVDGLETLKRGKQKHPHTQFIIMTAHGSLESAMQAIDQGAFNYVTKPFDDVDFVLSRIESALERVAIIQYNINMINRLQLVVHKLKRTQKENDAQKRHDQTQEIVQRISTIINELQEFRKKALGAGKSI
jgi:two-component system response regulator AtoC